MKHDFNFYESICSLGRIHYNKERQQFSVAIKLTDQPSMVYTALYNSAISDENPRHPRKQKSIADITCAFKIAVQFANDFFRSTQRHNNTPTLSAQVTQSLAGYIITIDDQTYYLGDCHQLGIHAGKRQNHHDFKQALSACLNAIERYQWRVQNTTKNKALDRCCA